jgi:hypothetical protein
MILAQTSSKRVTTPKKVSTADEVAELTQEVHQYEILLSKPEVTSDPYRYKKTREQWAIAFCNLELLTLPAPLIKDPVYTEGLFAACKKRLSTDENVEDNVSSADTSVSAPAKKENTDANTASCPNEPDYSNRVDLEPALKAISPGSNVLISGSVPGAKSGQIRLCVNNRPIPKLARLDPDGTFKAEVGTLTGGEFVSAQFVGTSKSREFGPPRTVIVGKTATCPGQTQDKSAEAPDLTPPVASGDKVVVAGSFKKLKSGKVQFCVDNTPQGDPVDIGTDGKFSITIPTLKNGQEILAQSVNLAADGSVQSFGPASNTLVAGSCQELGSNGDTKLKPKFSGTPDGSGSIAYSGIFSVVPPSGTVRVCVNDIEKASSLKIDDKGAFNAGALDLKAGDVAVAQFVASDSNSKTKFGPVSDEIPVGTCLAAQNVKDQSPSISGRLTTHSKLINMSRPTDNKVRICVDDIPRTGPLDATAGQVIVPDGVSLPAGKLVTLQEITPPSGGFYRGYAVPDAPQEVVGFDYSDKLTASFIGGVEQSGFSSQSNSTNAFLSAFFRGPYHNGSEKQVAPTVWGRIRLLGAPVSAATSSPAAGASFSVVAALTNPNGTITQSNLQTIGQAIDYVFGPELRLMQRPLGGATFRTSLIGGFGATSPLTSTDVNYSVQGPASDSQQCLQLAAAYPLNLKNSPNGSATVCNLVNRETGAAVKTLAFQPVDRSNFLLKYGAGVRFTMIYPPKDQQPAYAGSIDFSIGQDQAITGGKFHGAVFKIDGFYPLALGKNSFLYLFGSTAIKTTGNMSQTQIILASAPNPTAPLSADVTVLPLAVPNRDFNRIGIGVNITSIFCALSKDGCKTSDSGASSATSVASKQSSATTTAGSKPAQPSNTQ